MGIGTVEQDRAGVTQIAKDKACCKLLDRFCFETHGIKVNDLKDNVKKASALTAARM